MTDPAHRRSDFVGERQVPERLFEASPTRGMTTIVRFLRDPQDHRDGTTVLCLETVEAFAISTGGR